MSLERKIDSIKTTIAVAIIGLAVTAAYGVVKAATNAEEIAAQIIQEEGCIDYQELRNKAYQRETMLYEQSLKEKYRSLCTDE